MAEQREHIAEKKVDEPFDHVDTLPFSYGEEPPAHLHAKTFLVVFAVFMIYVAQLINIVGLGALARDIAAVVGGSSQTTWLVNSVAILTSVLSPPVCQAADYWGRKWLLISLTGFGVTGCIIVARATSMGMAIGGSCVVGISYGAQPLLHAISSEVVPRRYRATAQGACNVAAAVGGLIALLMGGALTRNGNPEGFRIYWYIAAAIYAVAILITLFLYNPPIRELQTKLNFGQKIGRMDWIGYALLSAGLVLFSVGLIYGNNPYPWTSPIVLAPFIIGFFVLVTLGIYEWKFTKEGMFHHGLFSQGRNFPIALICIFGEGLIFFTANNYFAFQVSFFWETDALLVGARYGIAFIVYAITAALGGIFCSKFKKVRWPTVIGLGSFVVFNICMATSDPTTNTRTWGYAVFVGFGLGLCLCAVVTVAQLSTPSELISMTSGLMISMRSIAGVIGLPIYSAIFSSKLADNLGPKVAEAVLPLGLPESSLPALIRDLVAHVDITPEQVPGVTDEIILAGTAGMLDAYNLGFRFVWITAGVFSFCATAVAVFLKDPKIEFNMHIDAPVEKVEELYETEAAHATLRQRRETEA